MDFANFCKRNGRCDFFNRSNRRYQQNLQRRPWTASSHNDFFSLGHWCPDHFCYRSDSFGARRFWVERRQRRSSLDYWGHSFLRDCHERTLAGQEKFKLRPTRQQGDTAQATFVTAKLWPQGSPVVSYREGRVISLSPYFAASAHAIATAMQS